MSTVDIGGTHLAYEMRGSGTPLLLVAGTGYPGSTWHLPELIDGLARRHTVITFDSRGTGSTPAGEEPFTTRGFASDAVALLRALDVGPSHVVGHSMGGRVGQWMAIDEPDAVRSLVLAATGAGGGGNPGQPAGLPVIAVTAMVEHGYRGYMERHIRSTFFTPEFADASPDRVRWLVEAFWAHRPSVRNYLRHMAARQNHDTSRELHRIRVPSVVVVGDRDTCKGPTGSHLDQSMYLHAHVPGADLSLLPGLSHGTFWQAPDVVVDTLLAWTARIEAAVASEHGAGPGGR